MTNDEAWERLTTEAKEWRPVGRKIYSEGLAYEVAHGYILDRPSPFHVYALQGDKRSGFQVMERIIAK